MKAICSPVKIPLGRLTTGQDESKMTNIEMIERWPFEKIAFFHFTYYNLYNFIEVLVLKMRENSEMAFMFLAAISIKIWKDVIFSKGQRSIISILAILDSSRPILMLRTRILTGEQTCFNL